MSASARVSTPSPHGFFWSVRVVTRNLFEALGFESASKTSHGRHKKPMLRSSHPWGVFPLLPRDYLRRRRVMRRISNVVIVALLSAAVAYGIVHVSGPTPFSAPASSHR